MTASWEHQQFLRLAAGNVLVDHDIDALLVSGDIFDNANPSAASQNACCTTFSPPHAITGAASEHRFDCRQPRFTGPTGSAGAVSERVLMRM
jgi:hypothetical protein